MKTIKIILIIISILVVGFFTTGLIVKETNYTAQVSINKPVQEVFKAFTKIEDVKKWIPEIKSIQTVTKNPGITGSIYNIVVLNQGQEIKMTEKIMAYVANEKITLFFDAENMLKKDDYLFFDKDGTTTITLNASCQSDSYIMACVFPFFKSAFKKQDQEYLNSFKNYIENN